jgi:hypothetical protein
MPLVDKKRFFITRAVNGLGQATLRTMPTTVVRVVESPSAAIATL